MKKTVVITLTALMEVEASEITADNGEIHKKTSELEDSINFILDADNHPHVGWTSTSSIVLDEETMNCGKCAECGCWTTDNEKPNSVLGVSYGATYKNRLLCDECLPDGHEWAF